jgi:hypothetical protein
MAVDARRFHSPGSVVPSLDMPPGKPPTSAPKMVGTNTKPQCVANVPANAPRSSLRLRWWARGELNPHEVALTGT